MNKLHFLLFLSIFQLTPLFGMASWLENLQNKFFACNHPQIIAEVKQILNNGSTVKETLTKRILDRQNQAFKKCFYFINQHSQELPGNPFYSDTEIENRLQSCTADLNTHLDSENVQHDQRIPKKILDYIKQRLTERGINPDLINIMVYDDWIKKNLLDGNDMVDIARYAFAFLPPCNKNNKAKWYLVLDPACITRNFNALAAILDHEIEHIAQHHTLYTEEISKLCDRIYNTPGYYVLASTFGTALLEQSVKLKHSFDREREYTADQVPALESITKARRLKKVISKPIIIPFTKLEYAIGSIFAGSAAIVKYIRNHNAPMYDYLRNGLIAGGACLGSLWLLNNFIFYICDGNSHPSQYNRYRALNKIEKYLRAEEYLKKQANRNKNI